MNTALINLISEQTVPNVLAIIQYKPNLIFFMHSNDPKFEAILHNFNQYVEKNYSSSPVSYKNFLVEALDPHSTYTACLKAIEFCNNNNFERIIINVTGGTKLMAFGALQAGIEKNCSVIYVNTQKGEFLSVNKQSNSENERIPTLKIKDFMDLYGAKIEDEKTKLAIEQEDYWKEFVRFALENLSKWHETSHFFNLTKHQIPNLDTGNFQGPNFTKDKQRQRLVYPDIATLHVLSKQKMIENLILKPKQLSFRKNTQIDFDWILQFGTALELYVFSILKDHPMIDDVKLSVQFSWGETTILEKNHNEIDVMVSYKSTLTFISCKSGKLNTEALNELETYAPLIGGIFANKILVTTIKNLKQTKLKHRARSMNIKIIAIETILKDPNVLIELL